MELGIAAEHLLFDSSCHSVVDAAAAVGASPIEFVKNICLVGLDGRFVVAIVPGDMRASRKRVAAALEIPMPEFADAEVILCTTGYPPGGTPSFCYDGQEIIVLIDQKILDRGSPVYTGGGSDRSLTRVAVPELVRAVL